MGLDRRRARVATVLAAALAMAAAAASGQEPSQSSHTRGTEILPSGTVSGQLVRHETTQARDSNGCSVTLHEYQYDDGSRRSVTQTVCDDGAVSEVERHYDARGNLAKETRHEITADGAVRVVDDADAGEVPAPDTSAKRADPKLPDVSADKADLQRTQEWLDAKFKEWKDEVEAQTPPLDHRREDGEH